MSDAYTAKVRAFNEAYGCDAPKAPGMPGSLGDRARVSRMNLITEEHAELVHGQASRDLIECLDALCDLEYVVCGVFVFSGADRTGQPIPTYPQTAVGPPQVPHADLFLVLSGDFLIQTGALSTAMAAGDWQAIAGQGLIVRARLGQLWAAFRVPEEVRWALFSEVHRSNMTKFGPDGKPVINEAGRVVKGPNYEPPDLLGVLRTFYGPEYAPPAPEVSRANHLSGALAAPGSGKVQ